MGLMCPIGSLEATHAPTLVCAHRALPQRALAMRARVARCLAPVGLVVSVVAWGARLILRKAARKKCPKAARGARETGVALVTPRARNDAGVGGHGCAGEVV